MKKIIFFLVFAFLVFCNGGLSAETDPGDYDTLWHSARDYSKEGLLEEKKSKKRELLRKAETYARRAIEVNEKRFEGHLYLAETLGKLTDLVGPESKVRFSREIKNEAEKALELNPSHFKPYMILGIWHKEVEVANWIEKQFAKVFFGGLPDASLEEAERNLKKSIELKADYPKSHYELALVYKAGKNKELAKAELQKTINCPILNRSDEEIKEKATKLLKKLK